MKCMQSSNNHIKNLFIEDRENNNVNENRIIIVIRMARIIKN